MYSVDTKLEKLKYLNCIRKYLHLYLNTVLTKIFTIVFVFGKFIVFVFVFKYYAMVFGPKSGLSCLYYYISLLAMDCSIIVQQFCWQITRRQTTQAT